MLKRGDGFCRVARAKTCLDIAYHHPRVLHNLVRLIHAVRQRCRTALFQGVAGRDQPPNPVKTKAFQRFSGDMDMASVRRIKGSTEQADRLA